MTIQKPISSSGYATRLLGAAALIALACACTATAGPQAGQIGSSAQTVPSIPPFASSGREDFDIWRTDFANRAMGQGRNPAVVYDVLRDLKPLEIYLPENPEIAKPQSAISEQAEFAKPVWEYLRTAVSQTRKETGASELRIDAPLFEEIERTFGVDKTVVAAIWGMETNFGGYIGNFDGPETLANMAVEGRRRGLAENELLATMKIIEEGHATRQQLVAGWAGAMGQTQFMPSTYLAHAVDFSNDGKRDVWTSRADALASAANYLKASGYVTDQPWGIEVRVPDGFNYAFSDGRKLNALAWQDMGLYTVTGEAITTRAGGGGAQARLWFPAGATGPAYLLFANFDVFLTYNRSNSYALAVGLLADGIGGRDGPLTPWPTDLAPLSVADVKDMQARLNALGFDAGAVDGVVGNGTRAALRAFQTSRGLLADGYPTQVALSYLRTDPGGR